MFMNETQKFMGWNQMLERLAEQVAAFPASEHDDMVDCTSMALARFRSGGFISLKSDVRDDNYSSPRKAAYY